MQYEKFVIIRFYPINKFIIGGEMDRDNPQKTYYPTSQSTIISSHYVTAKQLPTFNHNYGDSPDSQKNSQTPYTYQSYSTNTTGYNPPSNPGKEETYLNNYSNQYYDEYSADGQGILSRSAIVDNSGNSNISKLGELLSPTEKKFNLNKYVNMSTSKLEEYKLQEQPEDFYAGKEDTSPNNPKTGQNISFQFSPKKTKKINEHGYVRQLSGDGTELRPQPEKNNLSNYKKVELFNPNRDKRSISNQVSGNLKFNFNTHTANSNTQSPNASNQQNKLLKREFSSEQKVSNTLQGQMSPNSSPQTNYFSNQRKKEFITNSLSPKSFHNHSQSQKMTKEDFIVIRKLGKGKYGDVSLTFNRHVGIICALKVISKDTILKEQGGLNQFIREVTIQMFLSHQHIVECWGLFSDVQNVYLIMEPALDGQLFRYMKQKRQLSQSEAAGLIKQLCLGVEYLQSQKIIHRDLKPENILLHQGKLKIGDFGWAVHNQNDFRQTFCGTPLYLSPDVLKGEQYNDKVDNWAIGIITYEMLVGRIPFKITQQSEMQKIITEEIQFPNYINISDTAKDFVLALLNRNPDLRMDIDAMLMHKFLSQC